MKRYWLICISLLGFFINKAQIKSAETYFAEEQYELAAVGYEYLSFSANDPDSSVLFLMKKADCYKAMGDFNAANNVLSRLTVTQSDSLTIELLREKVVVSFLAEDFPETYQYILRLKLKGVQGERELIFYEFLTLVSLERWIEAKELLNANRDQFGLTGADVDSIFPKKLKPKNPEKAYNLSIFLPGVGQWYAGYPWRGIMSGAIQTGLVGFSLYSLYYRYFFSGALTGVSLFFTFYMGGANYAEKLAIRTNEARSQEIGLKFLELVKKK